MAGTTQFWDKTKLQEAHKLAIKHGKAEAARLLSGQYRRKITKTALCNALAHAGLKVPWRYPSPADPLADALADAADRIDRERRLNSDTESLKPGDLESEDYGTERRREYTESMGQTAHALRNIGTDPERLAAFTSLTAEQERRFLNKRIARSQSIGLARELLMARAFEQIAERVKWPVRPHGYAKKPKHKHTTRMSTLVLSDLHIGANLPGYENPETFDFTTAGRRLAHLAHETAEFKTQYRDQTQLNLGLNGDIIEGLLEHNDADNFPFAE
jgi:hypothetical protein